MKHITTLIFALMLITTAYAAKTPVKKIAGKPAESFRIVYSSDAEEEEGTEIAALITEGIKKQMGITLQANDDTAASTPLEILIGHTNRPASQKFYQGKPDTFDWSAQMKSGKVVLSGGGCWALMKATNVFLEAVKKGAKSLSAKGNIYGEFLFPRAEGSNLRILDDNIWEYDKNEIPQKWQELGVDCRNTHRVRYIAEVVFAYMPDIFTIQEYSAPMRALLEPMLKERGYEITLDQTYSFNHTPIYYNTNTVKLIESAYTLHGPKEFNNHNSKSFTSAVFELKANSKRFIVENTHLWWKSEKKQAGSNNARAAQLKVIREDAAKLIEKYDAPVFLIGDFNCDLKSKALKETMAEGYSPVWWEATVYGDGRNGHHRCDKNGFSRKSNRRPELRGTSAIDQFLIGNAKGTEIKTFYRIQAYFTVPVTDHYPNYADIAL